MSGNGGGKVPGRPASHDQQYERSGGLPRYASGGKVILGEALVFPVPPVARHLAVSAPGTFRTGPTVLAPLTSVCLPPARPGGPHPVAPAALALRGWDVLGPSPRFVG